MVPPQLIEESRRSWRLFSFLSLCTVGLRAGGAIEIRDSPLVAKAAEFRKRILKFRKFESVAAAAANYSGKPALVASC